MNDEDSVRAALTRLAESGVLAPAQVEPVAQAVRGALTERRDAVRVRWNEILAYVGAGLVAAGAAAFLGASWSQLTPAARVGVLWTITAVLLGGAGLLGWSTITAGAAAGAGRPGGRGAVARARLAGVLAALGSGTAAFGTDVIASDRYEALISGGVGLVVAIAGYRLLASPVGLIASAVLAVVTVSGALELVVDHNGLAWAAGYIVLGLVVAGLAVARLLPHRVLGLGIGAVIALIGAQQPVLWEDFTVLGYLATAVIAIGCFVLYQRERSWVLIVAGVVGVTLAVTEAIRDWTGGAIGGPLILVVAGVVLLAAGGLGVLLHRRTTS